MPKFDDDNKGQYSRSEYNKRYYEANTPYPVRLGDLKDDLQADAFKQSTSIAEVLRNVLKKHYRRDEINLVES